MNLESLTLMDCILYSIQGLNAIINDGKLIGFEQEEIPTQTANPSGDE